MYTEGTRQEIIPVQSVFSREKDAEFDPTFGFK